MNIQEALHSAMTISAKSWDITVGRKDVESFTLHQFKSCSAPVDIIDLLAEDWFVEVRR